MASFSTLLFIGLGGFIGTVLRYLSGQYVSKLFPQEFPYATLCINLIGCLAIGLVYGYFDKSLTNTSTWKSFLAVGVCGGYTTFSAFSIENLQLLRDGHFGSAILYIFISLIAGLALTFGGYMAMK